MYSTGIWYSHFQEDNEEKDEEEEEDDGFFVPHGYLSDDEGVDGEEQVKILSKKRKCSQNSTRNKLFTVFTLYVLTTLPVFTVCCTL